MRYPIVIWCPKFTICRVCCEFRTGRGGTILTEIPLQNGAKVMHPEKQDVRWVRKWSVMMLVCLIIFYENSYSCGLLKNACVRLHFFPHARIALNSVSVSISTCHRIIQSTAKSSCSIREKAENWKLICLTVLLLSGKYLSLEEVLVYFWKGKKAFHV